MQKLTLDELIEKAQAHIAQSKKAKEAKTVDSILITEDGQMFNVDNLNAATGYAGGKCKVFRYEKGDDALKLFTGHKTETVRVDRKDKIHRGSKVVHTPQFEDFEDGDSVETLAIAAQKKAQDEADKAQKVADAKKKAAEEAEAEIARAQEEEAAQKKLEESEQTKAEEEARKKEEAEEAEKIEAEAKAKEAAAEEARKEEEDAAKEKEAAEAKAAEAAEKEKIDAEAKAKEEADAKEKEELEAKEAEEAADAKPEEGTEGFDPEKSDEAGLIKFIKDNGLSKLAPSTLKNKSKDELKKIIADASASAE